METIEIKIAEGATLSAPVYESHSRGKNWMAVISANPKAPSGLDRSFQDKAHGDYYYIAEGLEVGDPIEFGADYYSGSGKPSRKRWYGVVIEVSGEKLVLERAETPAAAIKRAKEVSAQPIEKPENEVRDDREMILFHLTLQGFDTEDDARRAAYIAKHILPESLSILTYQDQEKSIWLPRIADAKHAAGFDAVLAMREILKK